MGKKDFEGTARRFLLAVECASLRLGIEEENLMNQFL